jgi:hypothetical protein
VDFGRTVQLLMVTADGILSPDPVKNLSPFRVFVTNLTTRCIVFTFCCLFVLLGMALIPYAGVQHDEAAFAAPLYSLKYKELCVNLFGHLIPLMVMSYAGTLKTLLYPPIFTTLGVSVWTVRLPMVVLGALTIWIFFYLSLRAENRWTALLAVALLATDPAFLLPVTFDWGPVALQHFLLVTGCLFLVRFGQGIPPRSGWNLALGGFSFGLAMWDKAVFIWSLAGLIFGTVIVFWPEVRSAFRLRNIALAAAGFLAGALPLVIYNIHNPNATASSNAHLETVNLLAKLPFERSTLNGSGVLGFIPAEDWSDLPKPPGSRRGRVAFWIHDHLGEHRTDGLGYAFILGLVAFPLWWRSRAARFCLIFLAVAWIAMAVTQGAGAAVHHAVLLWPFPDLFIAVVLGSMRWRNIAAVVLSVLVVMNLLVVNQHVYQFERNGAAGNFTDALFSLSDALPSDRPIYLMDWGMLYSLNLFHQGRLSLRMGSDPLITETPSPSDRNYLRTMLADRGALFVDHVPSRRVTPRVAEGFAVAVQSAGLEKEPIQTIRDSNGRPVFEIFRVVSKAVPSK